MITIVEYQDEQRVFILQTAFSVNLRGIAEEHFRDALENSANEIQYPYIAVTIYSDDGKTYIGSRVFETVKDAIEWWQERCCN